jgi:hypothetical protein
VRTSRTNYRTFGGDAAPSPFPTDEVGIHTAAAKYLPLAALLFCSAVISANAQEPVESSQALRFEGYPNAPQVSVPPRKNDLFFYPCDQCHESMEPNPEIRPLNAMHDSNLEHGRGRIWCLSCHDLDNRNYLKTLLNELVDIDEAYLVCGGCHANRQKDWYFGAHGKRLANWQGERTIYNCTHCHDPHSPAIKLRAPKSAPPVRAGLKLEHGLEHETVHVWDTQEEHEEP